LLQTNRISVLKKRAEAFLFNGEEDKPMMGVGAAERSYIDEKQVNK